MAAVVRLALEPIIVDRFPRFTFMLAITFAAWYGGLGPAILTLILGAIVWPLLVVLSGGVPIGGITDGVGYVIYLASGLAIALMGGSLHDSWKKAEKNAGSALEESERLEQEVAERRRAEQAEREQRQRLHATLSSVGDGVIVTDAIGRVVSLNPVAEGLTEWASAEAQGHMLKEVFRTLDAATNRSDEMPVFQVVRGGLVSAMEQTELVGRDGSRRSIEHCTSAIKDDQGVVSGVVIVFRDVTERKRAEVLLRLSEQRFRQLADTMPQVVWTAGSDGAVDYFNSRWYEYTGLTPKQSLSTKGGGRWSTPTTSAGSPRCGTGRSEKGSISRRRAGS